MKNQTWLLISVSLTKWLHPTPIRCDGELRVLVERGYWNNRQTNTIPEKKKTGRNYQYDKMANIEFLMEQFGRGNGAGWEGVEKKTIYFWSQNLLKGYTISVHPSFRMFTISRIRPPNILSIDDHKHWWNLLFCWWIILAKTEFWLTCCVQIYVYTYVFRKMAIVFMYVKCKFCF